MQVTGKYVGKSVTHLYFSSWYGSPNFRINKNKEVQYKINLKSKIVTLRNVDDVELLPRDFDFSKVIQK